nr:Chain B, Nucleoporin NUP53 [Thermochaetoides thermophila DSM 1495]
SQDDEFCRVIPTVRKAKLLPMEEALLPAPTFTQ